MTRERRMIADYEARWGDRDLLKEKRRKPRGAPPYKILWASPCWFRGGLETVTVTNIANMTHGQWEHVLIYGKCDGATSAIPDGVEVHSDREIHEWRFPPPKAAQVAAILKCQEHLREIRPDVVVSSLLPSMSVAALQEGVPVVLEYGHCGWGWDVIEHPVDLMIAVSRHTAEEIRRHRQRTEITVIHNGVSPAFSRSAACGAAMRARLGIPFGVKVIGFSGRLCIEKRPAEWVDAFAIVRRRLPTAVGLVVGGDFGNRKDLVDAAARNGLEMGKDIFEVTCDYSEMPDAYRAMDVLMHTRHDEPFGMVLVEALLCGTPVVAYRGGGVPEIAELCEGITLRDPGDVEGLALAAVGAATGVSLQVSVPDCFRSEAMSRSLEDLILKRISAASGGIIEPEKNIADENEESEGDT